MALKDQGKNVTRWFDDICTSRVRVSTDKETQRSTMSYDTRFDSPSAAHYGDGKENVLFDAMDQNRDGVLEREVGNRWRVSFNASDLQCAFQELHHAVERGLIQTPSADSSGDIHRPMRRSREPSSTRGPLTPRQLTRGAAPSFGVFSSEF